MNPKSSNSPILVITQRSHTNLFAEYIHEIMAVEGIFCYDTMEPGSMSIERLESYKAVILGNVELSASAQKILRNYADAGGNLVAFKPDRHLGDLFGVKPITGIVNSCADLFIRINQQHHLSAGLPVDTLQFHWQADLFDADRADVFATIGGAFGASTHYPAIVTHQVGKGRRAMFTYDLAASTVYFHQGLQQQSSLGARPDGDCDRAFKPNDLFVGFLDERLCTIPQADLHQDLFVRLLRWVCHDSVPFPRVWHFPNAAPAAALLSGDSDDMKREQVDFLFEKVRSAGGKYTLYLTTRGPLYGKQTIDNSEEWATMHDHYDFFGEEEIAALRAQGHDLGPHLFAGRKPTLEMLRSVYASGAREFEEKLGWPPRISRGHNAIWVGWDETALILVENGIRLDAAFIPAAPFQHGYLNGSALPVKFVSRSGDLIDCYEQSVNYTDDGMRSEKLLQPAMDAEQLIKVTQQTLDDLVDRYHGVYHPCLHPVMVTDDPQRAWIEFMVGYLKKRDFLFLGTTEWLDFNDARRSIHFEDLVVSASKISFTLSSTRTVEGLTVLFPWEYAGGEVFRLTIDSQPQQPHRLQLEGEVQLALILSTGPSTHIKVTVEYINEMVKEQ